MIGRPSNNLCESASCPTLIAGMFATTLPIGRSRVVSLARHSEHSRRRTMPPRVAVVRMTLKDVEPHWLHTMPAAAVVLVFIFSFFRGSKTVRLNVCTPVAVPRACSLKDEVEVPFDRVGEHPPSCARLSDAQPVAGRSFAAMPLVIVPSLVPNDVVSWLHFWQWADVVSTSLPSSFSVVSFSIVQETIIVRSFCKLASRWDAAVSKSTRTTLI